MKNRILVGISFIASLCLLNAQESLQNDLLQQELTKLIKIPNSPEAQAFTKYGNTQVSLYSGTPNVAIPLHSIKGREFELPITLTYDASGIKVEQMSTWVGIGWNLNAGGRISRLTNGLADDFYEGNYETTANSQDVIDKIVSYTENTGKKFPSEQAVKDYFFFLRDIQLNLYDTQPDVFSVNAPGLSTNIVFDTGDNNLPKSLDNPRIKISVTRDETKFGNPITSWTITNEEGTVYYFNEEEITTRYGDDYTNPYDFTAVVSLGTIINTYTSSWVLNKIESSNKKDKFEFNYHDPIEWSQPQLGTATSGFTTILESGVYSYPVPPAQFAGGAGHWIDQLLLESITYNNMEVMRTTLGSRSDVDPDNVNSRLSGINFFKLDGGHLKSVNFQNTDYFNLDNLSVTAKGRFEIRLKLNGIEILGKDGNVYENYAFEYNRPDDLPSRNSYAQDLYGFYNGEENNNTLKTLLPSYSYGSYSLAGANRDADETSSKIGMLSRITYPTGGYTEFSFEGNFKNQDVSGVVRKTSLDFSIDANDPTDATLYLNVDGSLYDDRYGFLDSAPKIKIVNFIIEQNSEVTPHQIIVTGDAFSEDIEAQIAFRGELRDDCVLCPVPTSFNNLSEFDAANIWNSTQYGTYTQYLQPGYYSALILLDEEGDEGSDTYRNLRLRVTRMENVISNTQLNLGGLRIKKISDFDSDGTFASAKEYQYGEAQENYIPNLINTNNGIQVNRVATFPQGNQPSIVYPNVIERSVDQTGNSLGYTSYTFYNGYKGLIPRTDKPFESNFFPSVKGSNLNSKEVYNANDGLLTSQENDYFELAQRPISVPGLTVTLDSENIDKWIFIGEHDINEFNDELYYNYTHVKAIPCPSGGGGGSPTNGTGSGSGAFSLGLCAPLPCWPGHNNPACGNYVSYMTNRYGGLNMRETFINGTYGGISVSKNSINLNDRTGNTISMETVSETVYEDELYLPKTVRFENSVGEIFKTEYHYPHENPSDFNELITQNKLTEVVKSTTIKQDENGNELKFISAMDKDYYTSSFIALPSKVLTSKKSSSATDLEERVEFTYYNNGNIKESKRTDGPTTTYVWGYDNMYPVAKIENATHAEVAGTGFSLSILSSLTSSEADKLNELQKIRDGLSDALVTSFTYDPMLGMTSMTDPRGFTIFYEYDDFNRLETVKDEEGNLVSQNQYHYKNQQ